MNQTNERKDADSTPSHHDISRRDVLLGMAAVTAGAALKTLAQTTAPASPKDEPKGLIVHEWGVKIRHVTSSGTMLASPAELVAGLPTFVALHEPTTKLEIQVWTKPVIWFYGPEQTPFSLQVNAPQGYATASFPVAQVLTRMSGNGRGDLLAESAGFTWQGSLTAQPKAALSQVAKDHWWQTARSAGGLYFNANDASERFIFYEATAFQEPPVSAIVAADSITLRNDFDAPSGQVILLLNIAGRHHAQAVKEIPAKGEVKVSRDAFMKAVHSPESLLALCAEQWKSFGLTGPESEAVVAVWHEDLLKPSLFLLISRMPPKLYDAMFPMTINPNPVELVRVGMVFDLLDNQPEVTAWGNEFQELQKKLAKAAQDLGNENFETRQDADRELANAGEAARKLLEDLLKSKDPEVSARAAALLKKITPDMTRPGPGPQGGNVLVPMEGGNFDRQ